MKNQFFNNVRLFGVTPISVIILSFKNKNYTNIRITVDSIYTMIFRKIIINTVTRVVGIDRFNETKL